MHLLPPLIVMTGPTGVGKTALSLELCRYFQGEVVNADSRQIYRRMAIGTAKPTAAEQAQVPHHLLDLREPDEPMSLAEYQQAAYAAIGEIHARGKVPFLIGGTALYIRAVVEGLRIPQVSPDPALRARLEAELAEYGRAALFARLQALDPATARVIDGKNPRRVLRALEIFLLTGKSKVELEGAEPPPYTILRLGLTRPRAQLYARIDRRVDAMLAQGLVGETKALLAQGYAPTLPAMSSLGYREITAYLRDELPLPEAVARIRTETHRFVRHQETWFRKLAGFEWFDLESNSAQAIRTRIAAFLA